MGKRWKKVKTVPSFELVFSDFQVMRSVEVWRTNGAFAVPEMGYSKLCEDWLVGLPNSSHNRAVERTVPAGGSGYALGALKVPSNVPQRTV